MKLLRASAAPLLRACSASAAGSPGEVRLDSSTPEARLGTAVHATVLGWINAGQHMSEPPSGIDTKEFLKLCRRAWQCWEAIQEHFPGPVLTEHEMWAVDHPNRLEMRGHADIIAATEDEVRIADLKTGWDAESDHEEQMGAYAWLGLHEFPETERAYTAVIHVRTMEREARYWTRQDAAEWYAAVLERLDDTRYFPGRHCRFCPRALVCPALTEVLSQTAEFMLSGDDEIQLQLEEMNGAALAKLWEYVGLLEKRSEWTRGAVKARLRATGPLPVGDGREVALVPQERRHLIPLLAWDACERAVGRETLLRDVAELRKGRLEEAVRATAGKGQKGAAVTALMEQLEADGALAVEETEVLRIRKQKAPQLTGAE